MKRERGLYVDSGAGALKRRGSAGLGVITERNPDIAVKRQTHLIGLDIKRCTQAQMQTLQVPTQTEAKM